MMRVLAPPFVTQHDIPKTTCTARAARPLRGRVVGRAGLKR
jgi:hypothetical protein